MRKAPMRSPLLAFILERVLIDYGADGDLLLKEYEA